MRRAITPVVSIILLSLITIGASTLAFFWVAGVQEGVQETASESIESQSISGSENFQVISLRGDGVTIHNVGSSQIENVSIIIDGELTGYGLNSPLSPGEAAFISFTQPLRQNEEHTISVAGGMGITASKTVSAGDADEESGYSPQCSVDSDCDDIKPCTENKCVDNTCTYPSFTIDGEYPGCNETLGCTGNTCACISGTCTNTCGIGGCQDWENYTDCNLDCAGVCREEEASCGNAWFTGVIKGATDYNYCACCGDDGGSDDFYNGTVGVNASYCWNGLEESDVDNTQQSWCETNNSYNWMLGSITGSNGPCCGDDAESDEFYNGTLSSSEFFCQEGSLINQGVDENRILCEEWGSVWFTGTTTGSNNSCCGDDGVIDDFYNGSITNTTSFCNNGYYINQGMDSNQSLCEYYSFEWFTGDIDYPGTYSFTDDVVGSIPDDWTVTDADATQWFEVVSELDGHSRVLRLYDNKNGSPTVKIKQLFSSTQTTGTLEFWVRTSHINKYTLVGIRDGWTDNMVYLQFATDGTINYYDGSTHVLDTYLADKWYHIRIYFDTAVGWSIWINGVLKGYELGFRGSPLNMDIFTIDSGSTVAGYSTWFDAISYSWDDDYDTGKNQVPRCCGDDAEFDDFYNYSSSDCYYCANGSSNNCDTTSYCDGDTLYYNGECTSNGCVFDTEDCSITPCKSGCSGGSCTDETTNWGDNIYNCVGSNKRCISGTCYTCSNTATTYFYAGQCWHLADQGDSCTTACQEDGANCITSYWDDTSYNVCKYFHPEWVGTHSSTQLYAPYFTPPGWYDNYCWAGKSTGSGNTCDQTCPGVPQCIRHCVCDR